MKDRPYATVSAILALLSAAALVVEPVAANAQAAAGGYEQSPAPSNQNFPGCSATERGSAASGRRPATAAGPVCPCAARPVPGRPSGTIWPASIRAAALRAATGRGAGLQLSGLPAGLPRLADPLRPVGHPVLREPACRKHRRRRRDRGRPRSVVRGYARRPLGGGGMGAVRWRAGRDNGRCCRRQRGLVLLSGRICRPGRRARVLLLWRPRLRLWPRPRVWIALGLVRRSSILPALWLRPAGLPRAWLPRGAVPLLTLPPPRRQAARQRAPAGPVALAILGGAMLGRRETNLRPRPDPPLWPLAPSHRSPRGT